MGTIYHFIYTTSIHFISPIETVCPNFISKPYTRKATIDVISKQCGYKSIRVQRIYVTMPLCSYMTIMCLLQTNTLLPGRISWCIVFFSWLTYCITMNRTFLQVVQNTCASTEAELLWVVSTLYPASPWYVVMSTVMIHKLSQVFV